jgi:hypothetical protein
MKRMRFLAIIFTLLISIVGGNFTASERVFAQSSTGASQTSLSTYQSKGVALFNNQLSLLNEKKRETVFASDPKNIVAANLIIDAVSKASGVFSTELNKASTKANWERYEKALNLAISSISEDQRTKMISLVAPYKTYTTTTITIFTKQLSDEAIAERRSAGMIQGGATSEQAQIDAQGTAAANNTAVTNATNQAKATDNVVEEVECGFGNISACAKEFIVWIIKTFLLELAGFMVWVSANMMNYAIKVGILDFAKWAPDTLYPIWLVVRQITSLFVVFAGLWLGFMYIINKGKEFEKYIPFVILFGLFVNFSYPLVRTVIDVSNIVSLNLYASAVGNNALTAKATDGNTAGALIMNKIGLQGLVFSATKVDTSKSDAGKLSKASSVPGALMAVGFVFYAAYVFFIITFLLVTRTAVLVFIIIASPLLFVDKVIPRLGGYASKLRDIFWEMLFVGPVFTIMLALTLKFLDAFNVIKETGVAAGGEATIVEFFNILMMLIMLHIMFKVTKATSGSIGQAVSGAMSGVGTLAVGGVAGLGMRAGFAGMAAAGRGTLGRAGSALQGSPWATKTEGFGSGASRALFRASGAMANANYDARNTSIVQKGGNMLGISGGMGQGGKLGREALIDARAKEDRTRRNFARSSSDTRDQRVKDDYNAIPANDAARRTAFLTNLEKTNSVLYKKIKDEESNKALAEYKTFTDDTEGKKKKDEFFLKHSGDEEIAQRLQEYDNKTASDKEDKKAQRQDSKEATQAMKDLAAAMNPKNQRLGGEDPNKGSSGLGAESVASHTAQTKYVAPRPVDAPVPQGYVEQGGLLVPVNMKPNQYGEGTSPTGSGVTSQKAPAPFNVNAVDLSRLNGKNPDTNPVESIPSAPTGGGGVSTNPAIHADLKSEELSF